MASKLQPSFFLLLLLAVLLPAAAAAHDITRILSKFPDFSTFNSLLSRTSVAAEINRRQTITVLALKNSAAAPISGLPEKTLAQVLSIHVLLDYYDATKIRSLKGPSALLTTLFQSTGVAKNSMGFLNCTRLSDGRMAFGSGVPGAPLVSTFVKSVAAKPYNISVLQISNAVVPPGIDSAPVAPFGAPITANPEPLVPAPAPADDGVAEAPEGEVPAPTADAPAPAADASAEEGPGPAAASDDLAPSGEEGKSSSGRRMASGVSLLVAAGVAFLAL